MTSSETARIAMQHAFHLMQSGDTDAALILLEPLRHTRRNDPRVWWLIANAAPTRAEAIAALQNVLRLQPQHRQARLMLAHLNASNVKLRKAQAYTDNATEDIGRVDVICNQCGAETQTESGIVPDQCAFCGSGRLRTQDGIAVQDAIHADQIIPFRISRDEARITASKWVGRYFFAPDALRHATKMGAFIPLYVPFWVVDMQVGGSWKHYEYDRRDEPRLISEGKIRATVKNVAEPAIRRLGTVRIRQVADYHLAIAEPFDPEKAAGVAMHIAEIAAYEALDGAMQVEISRRIFAANRRIPKGAELFPRYFDEDWRLVMCPLYLTTYRFRDKTYQIVVNGQTGNIAGQHPVDWVKVIALLLIILIPAVVLALVARSVITDEGLRFLIVLVDMGAALLCVAILARALVYDDV